MAFSPAPCTSGPFAFLAIAAEFFGGLGLIFGLLTRVAAFGIFVNMVMAVRWFTSVRLFMNWTGAQKGEGYEYHFCVGDYGFLMIRGAGAASVDRLCSSSLRTPEQGLIRKHMKRALAFQHLALDVIMRSMRR